MIKKLSLQWRLTLMTALLVTAACLLLNLLVGRSAVLRIDDLGDSILTLSLPEEAPVMFELDLTAISRQLQESKDIFRLQSLGATALVILLASALTYFLAGRILAPLHRFSAHMEEIQAKNLSQPVEVPDTRDEIAQLARSFNRMLKTLDQSFEMQRQFSANAAHELRTPLAMIQTKLDIFGRRGQHTQKEYDEALSMLREQTGRLSQFVEVLLEMTELQTAQRADRISLGALAEEVLCDLSPVAEEKQITLDQTGQDVELTGNDLLLYRAVYNLVENAVKYNRPGGRVTVDIRREPGRAVLTVSDTGIGIAPENCEKIFDPFFRVDKSRSRTMGGAGLGLSLVREIALQHGGDVRVQKSSREGTKMALCLPLS